mgnify:CR=1 FL=1
MVIVIYLVILVAAFFFLIVRPQRRQAQVRRQLLAAVRVGDEIVTSGGIHAVVVSLADDTVEVSIAPGVEVTLARGAIAARLSAPGDDEHDDADDTADDAATDDDEA